MPGVVEVSSCGSTPRMATECFWREASASRSAKYIGEHHRISSSDTQQAVAFRASAYAFLGLSRTMEPAAGARDHDDPNNDRYQTAPGVGDCTAGAVNRYTRSRGRLVPVLAHARTAPGKSVRGTARGRRTGVGPL